MFTFKSTVPRNRKSAKKSSGSWIFESHHANKKGNPKDVARDSDVEKSEIIMEIVVWALFITIFLFYSIV